jgi:serine phosphatase RsbU (regulator of sigma subunit)
MGPSVSSTAAAVLESKRRLGDAKRLAALERSGLLGLELEHTLAALTRLATEVIGVPVALVSLVTDDRQVFVGAHGLPEPWASRRQTGLSHSFCRLVIEDNAPLVIDDARRNPRTAENLAIDDIGVIAYAGTPLHDPEGQVLGSVCAIDDQPHRWSDRELDLLEQFNAVVAALITDRAGITSGAREQLIVATQTDQLARRLQRALLPVRRDELTDRGVTAYQPGSERLLLGGDFSDLHLHPNGDLGFVLGDICGHGPESAAMAIGIRGSWAALESQSPAVDDLAAQLNRIALREQRDEGGMFTSLILGRLCIDQASSHAVNAGHPSPINLDDVSPIELSPGPVIGLFPDAHWTSTPLPPLPAGMLLYTDGLTEGRAVPGSHERWGDQRLLATVAAELRARRPHAELPLSLIRAATAAHGDELPDDVAILIVR